MLVALIIVSVLMVLGWYRASVWKYRCEVHEWCEWAKDKDFSKVHYAGKD